MKLHLRAARLGAKLVQSIAAHLANRGHRPHQRAAQGAAHDIYKSARIARLLRDGDRVLDIGCGDGLRLSELSIFRSDLKLVGVDLAPPRAPKLAPGGSCPRLSAFNGAELPFEDGAFDVVLLCYVLHHLTPLAASGLLKEGIRCARRSVILLEDSMPTWSLAYKIRNLAHIHDTNIQYGAESEAFAPPLGTQMFMTREEWRRHLESFPQAKHVEQVNLDDISLFRHHSLFHLELIEK